MFPLQSAPESVCILRLSAIGDVTHVLPVLRTLQHHWPQTRISWIIGKAEASLLQDLPGVQLLVVDKKQTLQSWLDLRRKLKNQTFDVLLHMQAALRASIFSLAVPAKIRLGFDPVRGKNQQRLFVQQSIEHVPKQHVLESFLSFPRALGIENSILRWDLPIPPRDRKFAARLMPEGRQYLVINPCASVRVRNFRNWQAQSYAEVINYAACRYGLRTLLTGGKNNLEINLANKIIAHSSQPVQNLVGRTSLKQLTAVLARARVVIAPDTGPLHIANAVGTPVIGLYATSNPKRTGPYLFQDLTVNRYPEAVQQEFGLGLEDIPWGQRVRNKEAMQLITVQEVQQKLDKALQITDKKNCF